MRVPIKAEGARIEYDEERYVFPLADWRGIYGHREVALGYEITKNAISDNLYGSVPIEAKPQTLEDLVKQNERLSKSWEERIDRLGRSQETPSDAGGSRGIRELID